MPTTTDTRYGRVRVTVTTEDGEVLEQVLLKAPTRATSNRQADIYLAADVLNLLTDKFNFEE
jgi:hypothetical protein